MSDLQIPDAAWAAAYSQGARQLAGPTEAIEAAAPFIVATELRRQADILRTNAAELDGLTDADRNAYLAVADLLTDRAFELDGGEPS